MHFELLGETDLLTPLGRITRYSYEARTWVTRARSPGHGKKLRIHMGISSPLVENASKTSFSLPTQVVNDKGRYHSHLAIIRISLSRCDEVPSLRSDSGKFEPIFLRADNAPSGRNLAAVEVTEQRLRRQETTRPAHLALPPSVTFNDHPTQK